MECSTEHAERCTCWNGHHHSLYGARCSCASPARLVVQALIEQDTTRLHALFGASASPERARMIAAISSTSARRDSSTSVTTGAGAAATANAEHTKIFSSATPLFGRVPPLQLEHCTARSAPSSKSPAAATALTTSPVSFTAYVAARAPHAPPIAALCAASLAAFARKLPSSPETAGCPLTGPVTH